MSRPMNSTLSLLPPPGPLCWLYPELCDAMRIFRKGFAVPDRAEVLDLSDEGLLGRGLIDTLLRKRSDPILTEDGPRGYTLWTWLNQALRKEGIDLPRPSPSPPLLEDSGGSAGARPARPIESLLAGVPRSMEMGGTVLVDLCSPENPVMRIEPLAPREPPISGRLRLMPFHPEQDLDHQLEHAVNAVSSDPSAYRSAGAIPYFVTASPGEGRPGETRLLPSWWGLLPGDAYSWSVRILFRELVRLLYPERMFLFMAFENHALAGVDLFLEGLMGRFESRPAGAAVRKKGRPLIIGVCGIDGSGKSSHVGSLENFLTEKGLKVKRHKIYRHGVFHETVTDLTRQCDEGQNLHLWRIQRIVKAFDSVKYFYSSVDEDLDACDVLLFDRYIYTHFAAGAGRYHHDPFARELLSVFPPADRIYLLDVPSSEALARIGERDEKTVDENPYMLSRFRHALLDLSEQNDFMVLDARRPYEENKKRILEDAGRLVEDSGIMDRSDDQDI